MLWIHLFDDGYKLCPGNVTPGYTHKKSVDTCYGYTFLMMDTKLCPGNVILGYTSNLVDTYTMDTLFVSFFFKVDTPN